MQRLARFLILLHRNFRSGTRTTAYVEVLPGDTMRITLHVARPWRFSPGQYLFLCVPAVGGWTSHPFSIAWAGDPSAAARSLTEKSSSDHLSQDTTSQSISLLIRRRTGFTDKLFKTALTHQHSHRSTLSYSDDPMATSSSFLPEQVRHS